MRINGSNQVVVDLLDSRLIIDITAEVVLATHVVGMKYLLLLEGLPAYSQIIRKSYFECVSVGFQERIFGTFLDAYARLALCSSLLLLLFVYFIYSEERVGDGVPQKYISTLETEELGYLHLALMD